MDAAQAWLGVDRSARIDHVRPVDVLVDSRRKRNAHRSMGFDEHQATRSELGDAPVVALIESNHRGLSSTETRRALGSCQRVGDITDYGPTDWRRRRRSSFRPHECLHPFEWREVWHTRQSPERDDSIGAVWGGEKLNVIVD